MKIICIVGGSGSGKSFIAEQFRDNPKYHLLDSWTTRPPRVEGEKGHQYTSLEELGIADLSTEEQITALKANSISYTFFNGNHYFVNYQDLHHEKPNIFVVDEEGVAFLKECLPLADLEVWSINAPVSVRLTNMLKRGDSIQDIDKRMAWDDKRDIHVFSDYILSSSTYGYDAITKKWKRFIYKYKGFVKVNKK